MMSQYFQIQFVAYTGTVNLKVAVEALKGSTGRFLTFVTSKRKGVGCQPHVQVALLMSKTCDTHYTTGWVSSSAGLDVCGKEKIPCLHRGSNPEPSILL
jgi:hypothetical protein